MYLHSKCALLGFAFQMLAYCIHIVEGFVFAVQMLALGLHCGRLKLRVLVLYLQMLVLIVFAFAGACMGIAGVLRCALLVSAGQMFTLLAHLRSLHMWLTRALLVHAFLAHTVMIRTLLALLACALLAHTLHHTSHTHCIIVRTQIASLYHTHCAHLYLQVLVSRCI